MLFVYSVGVSESAIGYMVSHLGFESTTVVAKEPSNVDYVPLSVSILLLFCLSAHGRIVLNAHRREQVRDGQLGLV